MLSQAVIDQCTQDLCDIRGFDRTELTHLEKGYAECRAYPGPDCANDVGTVHGGFLLALADQTAAQPGTEKTGAAGDQDAEILFHSHV